jgi:ribosomal protein S12 methylthiotransferase accessory factor
MDMDIVFPGGDRVEARWGRHVVTTDQDGSAPAPFDLFLASIGTCAGIFVSRFCRKRGLSVEGLRICQHAEIDPATHLVERIEIEVHLPPDFPERYREAVLRAAGQCAVKRHLERPPAIAVHAVGPPLRV